MGRNFSRYNSRLDGICSNVCSRGGIAQLGERLHGMQEVIGSIPFTSTNLIGELLRKFKNLIK